jgi:hypothetical protein
MKYVSVLTPPALVCAVFIIAVVAFLRHEMGARRRRSEDLPSAGISGEHPIPERKPDERSDDIEAAERSDDN